MLNVLLYPARRSSRAATTSSRPTSMLGACDFETGDRAERASASSRRRSQLEPDNDARSDCCLPTGAIRVFDETKAEIEAARKAATPSARSPSARSELARRRESLVVVERHPFCVNFVPFGAGQFQNERPRKGVLFAADRGRHARRLSVGIWGYLVDKYGIDRPARAARRRRRRAPAPADRDRHRRRVLRALRVRRRRRAAALQAARAVEVDDSLLPPELRDLDKPRRRRPPKTVACTSLRCSRRTAPASALAWEN